MYVNGRYGHNDKDTGKFNFSLKTSLITVNFGIWRKFSSSWIRTRIRILKPDLDPGANLNTDPRGSGFATLDLGMGKGTSDIEKTLLHFKTDLR